MAVRHAGNETNSPKKGEPIIAWHSENTVLQNDGTVRQNRGIVRQKAPFVRKNSLFLPARTDSIKINF